MEHHQLIQSAFASYLAAISPAPWTELTNDSGDLRIFAGQDDTTKDGARIVCAVTGDLTEQPQFSCNRWADVEITLRTPVVDDGGASLTYHQANALALQNALMDTGLVSGLTSSSLHVYSILDRNPFQNEDADFWESGMRLRIYSLQLA